MVMTWVISSPSRRMGILLSRKRRVSPPAVTSCSVCWISPVSNTRSNSARSCAAGCRVSTSKTGPADHVVAPEPLGAGLALPVPALDAVVPVHDVESHRQAVDDQAGEPAVLLDLARLRRHLPREVGRQLDRREIGRQEVGDDRERAPRSATASPSRASSSPSRTPSCSST